MGFSDAKSFPFLHILRLLPEKKPISPLSLPMPVPLFTPRTPLDVLRAHLQAYGEGDTEFQQSLLAQVKRLKRLSLKALGPCLLSEHTPKGLRKHILGLASQLDWPEWAPFITQCLAKETDLSTFDVGAMALGNLGTREAWQSLQQLKAQRPSPDHQIILNRELTAYTASHPFNTLLNRLQEGASNPKLAQQNAKPLAAMAGPEHLLFLINTFKEGDDLTRKLALQIVAGIDDPGATEFLKEWVVQLSEEILDSHALMESLRKSANNNRSAVKEELHKAIANQFATRCPEAVEALTEAMVQAADTLNSKQLLAPMVQMAKGANENFLLEGFELLLESKIARFSAYHAESQESADREYAKQVMTLEQAAEALLQRVYRHQATLEGVYPVLEESFRFRVGNDGFLDTFLSLLPPTRTDILDALLSDPDVGQRQKYFNGIGSREEDAFLPFFMKALQDPIIEMGQLAMHHLAKLPSALPTLMEAFHSGQQDLVRRSIRVFGENRTAAAAEALLAFVSEDHQDELLVEAVCALGRIGYAAATPVLLTLLHDGKPLSLQVALCEALNAFGTQEASLGLLQRSSQLKYPQVLMLCLKGSLAGFTNFNTPFPTVSLSALTQLMERCWDNREGEGQRLSAALAMLELYTFDPAIYESLRVRFSDYLSEMRTQETWDKNNNEKVALVVKEMGQRSVSLGLVAKKESALQTAMHQMPPKGPSRTEALLALRTLLQEDTLILRPEMALVVGAFAFKEMHRETNDWRDLAHLCEMAGLSQQQDLQEKVHEIYHRATGVGLKSAAKKALLELGLTEQQVGQPLTVRTILVLDPSTFFRKKVMGALASEGRWTLFEAANRQEAEPMLALDTVDLLLTETQDVAGDMHAWINEQWNQSRCKRVILSSSSRNLEHLPSANWYEAALFKPYPMEKLLQLLTSSADTAG